MRQWKTNKRGSEHYYLGDLKVAGAGQVKGGIMRTTRTRQEQQAYVAGRALAKALLRIEAYDGDPTDVVEEARIFLSSVPLLAGREGAGLSLDWLEDGFDREYDKEGA